VKKAFPLKKAHWGFPTAPP